ncbi:hypothetical protein K8S19_06185 [bacterium]|nr:hypothetical protein [bacterium]
MKKIPKRSLKCFLFILLIINLPLPTVADYDPRLAVWVRLGALETAIQSLEGREDKISRVLVSDHCIDKAGVGLGYRVGKGEARAHEIIAWCQARGLPVYMGLGNYGGGFSNPKIITRMLSTPSRRSRHIKNIKAEVVRLGYDGVDLDYENLPAHSRRNFTRFVRELNQVLQTAGKGLDVTVPLKFSSPGWPNSQAYDWKQLPHYVGRFNVMCYDWYIRSGPPGPIIPLGVTKKVIKFIKICPNPEKFWIGHPTYGNDWVRRKNRKYRGKYAGAKTFLKQAKKHSRLISHRTQHMGGFEVGPFAHYSYKAADGVHHVWYGDHHSLKATQQVVQDAGLGGLFIWRAGFEDERIWDVINPARDETSAVSSSQPDGVYHPSSLP